MAVTMEQVAEHIRDGSVDQAETELNNLAANENNGAELLFLKGYLAERRNDLARAVELYEQVLQQEPDHSESLFRAALLSDLLGDDFRAIELYERCIRDEPAHVNAMLNLAIVYEENGRLSEARAYTQKVLAEHPNHYRARKLAESIDSSFSMYYDEVTQREREKRNALLDIPISEFELSVRSRNCLKQMNIGSLGDLLSTSEEELLSYKNFGETSLNEIKAMLTQKGLKLGQGLPESLVPIAIETAPPSQFPGPGENAILLNRPVAELELSVRSRKCLQRLGITTFGELTQRTEAELMATKNFGLTSLAEIKRQLAVHALSLRNPS